MEQWRYSSDGTERGVVGTATLANHKYVYDSHLMKHTVEVTGTGITTPTHVRCAVESEAALQAIRRGGTTAWQRDMAAGGPHTRIRCASRRSTSHRRSGRRRSHHRNRRPHRGSTHTRSRLHCIRSSRRSPKIAQVSHRTLHALQKSGGNSGQGAPSVARSRSRRCRAAGHSGRPACGTCVRLEKKSPVRSETEPLW